MIIRKKNKIEDIEMHPLWVFGLLFFILFILIFINMKGEIVYIPEGEKVEDKVTKIEKDLIHEKTMAILQDEWDENKNKHLARHAIPIGVKSSQISALVGLLIELEVIQADKVEKVYNLLQERKI